MIYISEELLAKATNSNEQQLRLTLELPQSVNRIYGRNMKYGNVYLKKEGKEYKKRMVKYIKEEVSNQKWDKVEGRFLYMDEIVYLNRKGRDADNLKKLQQDCITESGVVWEDDSWCLPRTQRILIDKDNPRIELIITPCNFIGIFDDKQQLKEFVKICKDCRRYNNNCTILQGATEGRIQEEINNIKCTKFKKLKSIK